MTMIAPVTLTIAAAAAVINLWLAMRIVPMRVKDGVLHGDGGNDRLAARMRAQANFVEYAPFVLILLGLIELGGGSAFWLWVIGAAFVVARIAHAFGMDRMASNPWRAGGALVTWGLLALLAGWALVVAYDTTTAATTRAAPVDVTIRRG